MNTVTCRTSKLKLLFAACLLMLAIAILILYMRKTEFEIITIEVVDFDEAVDVLHDGEMETNLTSYGPEIEQRFPQVRELSLRKRFTKFFNEDTRVVARPYSSIKTPAPNSAPKLIYLATPYFGECKPRHYYYPLPGSDTFRRYRCPVKNCVATSDPSRLPEADALLFHVRDLKVSEIPRTRAPNQLWILYSMEPAWLEIVDMRRFDGLFNWTMSYREGSDIRVQYGFVGRRPRRTVTAASRAAGSSKKVNVAVWYVSDCCTDSRREEYVRRLRTSYPVDVFGGCSVEACGPAESKPCYSDKIFGRYKFYLSFENALCSNYVTEKLYDALEADVIPVVFGGADYASVAPRHSVIDALLFDAPEELAAYLWQVSNNDTLYRSYFWWKKVYRAYLQPWMCELCERLHDAPGGGGAAAKSASDLEEWWTEGHSCRRWTEDGLEAVDVHPFPCYRQKLF